MNDPVLTATIKIETTGWICPRCGKSNAPDVKACDCKPDAIPAYPVYPVYPAYPVYPTAPYAPPWWQPSYPTYPSVTCCASTSAGKV